MKLGFGKQRDLGQQKELARQKEQQAFKTFADPVGEIEDRMEQNIRITNLACSRLPQMCENRVDVLVRSIERYCASSSEYDFCDYVIEELPTIVVRPEVTTTSREIPETPMSIIPLGFIISILWLLKRTKK